MTTYLHIWVIVSSCLLHHDYYLIMTSYHALQTEEDSKPGEGWKLVRMDDGRVYYYHQVTRRTTWDVAETWAH